MSRLSREKKREQKQAAHAATPAAPIDVHVPGAGASAVSEGASVGGVRVFAAPGEEIQQAVLGRLHHIALATGHAVLATVHDERIGYVVPLRVDPDGSSHFTAEPTRTTPPTPAGPPPPPPTHTPPAGPAQAFSPGATFMPPAGPVHAAPAGPPRPASAETSGPNPAEPLAAPPAGRERHEGDRATHVLRPAPDPARGTTPTFPLRAVPEPEPADQPVPTFELRAVQQPPAPQDALPDSPQSTPPTAPQDARPGSPRNTPPAPPATPSAAPEASRPAAPQDAPFGSPHGASSTAPQDARPGSPRDTPPAPQASPSAAPEASPATGPEVSRPAAPQDAPFGSPHGASSTAPQDARPGSPRNTPPAPQATPPATPPASRPAAPQATPSAAPEASRPVVPQDPSSDALKGTYATPHGPVSSVPQDSTSPAPSSSAVSDGTVGVPTGAFGPPPSMDARPLPVPGAGPGPGPRPEPVPDAALLAADPDPKPTPARGFDAVAEAVLGDEPLGAPGDPAAPALLAEPVARINEAVKEGRIEAAADLADRTVTQASGTLGPEHPEVLRLRELTAYIAYLAGDPLRAFHLSLDLAGARRRSGDAEGAYGNVRSAATAWRAVRDPALGLELGRDLVGLWTELASAGGPAAEEIEELESARARMGRLTARARAR
ncbi:tetratricopeptide repeat protein [Streptomyces sp. NPDC093516]|uniref:tetratricopeptide repeat protein n=1 Tax=Streptomyces sp. NPDC093516 TaxID=3155304 RepID=UPI003429DCBE